MSYKLGLCIILVWPAVLSIFPPIFCIFIEHMFELQTQISKIKCIAHSLTNVGYLVLIMEVLLFFANSYLILVSRVL